MLSNTKYVFVANNKLNERKGLQHSRMIYRKKTSRKKYCVIVNTI